MSRSMKDGKSWYSYHGNLHDLTFYNIYPIQTIIKYGVRTKHKATSHQMTLYLTLSLSLSLSLKHSHWSAVSSPLEERYEAVLGCFVQVGDSFS